MINSAIALSQQQTQMQVQTSVFKKTLETEKMVGEMLVGLIDSGSTMQSEPRPGISNVSGKNFDAYA